MKLTLDQTYIYNGKFYGPGEIEIEDEEAAQSIRAKLNLAQQDGDAAPAPENEPPAPENEPEHEPSKPARSAGRKRT
jgi:hypothetical protein